MSDLVIETSKLRKIAEERYLEGFSCSESIIRAVYEEGFIDDSISVELLNRMASAFSGGMSSGCLCGAVAGSQIVLGLKFGRKDNNKPTLQIKTLSKTHIDKFKEKRKVVCCKALSNGYEFSSPDRRLNCKNIVGECAEILEELMNENII